REPGQERASRRRVGTAEEEGPQRRRADAPPPRLGRGAGRTAVPDPQPGRGGPPHLRPGGGGVRAVRRRPPADRGGHTRVRGIRPRVSLLPPQDPQSPRGGGRASTYEQRPARRRADRRLLPALRGRRHLVACPPGGEGTAPPPRPGGGRGERLHGVV